MITLRRRTAALAAGLLSTLLVLTACGGGADSGSGGTGGTRSFQADNGTVDIPADPQRIVTMGSPGVFLGIGVKPVGMTALPDTPLLWVTPEQRRTYEAATNISAAGGGVDYEKVASVRPDLIVVHVPRVGWEKNFDNERLGSIAPTVWIQIDNSKWKTQGQRVADAVGELDLFTRQKAAYDALVADIRQKYGTLLASTTFAVVTRWAESEQGTFARRYSGSYCTSDLDDAGFTIPGAPPAGTTEFESVSMERLGDLAGVDAIIYDLGENGKTSPYFAPVLESKSWQALPAVKEGRALGVQCNNAMTYEAKTSDLQSAKAALGQLAARK